MNLCIVKQRFNLRVEAEVVANSFIYSIIMNYSTVHILPFTVIMNKSKLTIDSAIILLCLFVFDASFIIPNIILYS